MFIPKRKIIIFKIVLRNCYLSKKKKKREKQDILPVIITFFTDSRRRIVIIDNYSKCRNTQIDSSKIDDFSTNSSFSSHRCKIH